MVNWPEIRLTHRNFQTIFGNTRVSNKPSCYLRSHFIDMSSIQIDTLNCPPLQAVLNRVLYLLDTVRLLDNLLVCYRQNGSSRTSPAQSVLTLPEPSSMSEVLPGLGVSEVASIQNGKTKLCKEKWVMITDEEYAEHLHLPFRQE